MRWQRLTGFAFLAIVVAAPTDASGQESSAEPPRFSLSVAAGSNLHDGGDVQAASFGFGVGPGMAVWLNVERDHVPTRVQQYPDGFSATRGGTLTSISGEFRYTAWRRKRVSPFGFAGLGGGAWEPNVNDVFPRGGRTTLAQTFYFGGGALFSIHPNLAVSIDGKFQVMVAGEAMGGMAPIRAGVTWRF